MKKNLVAMLVAAFVTAAPAWAQDRSADEAAIASLRTAVQKDKRALVASTLNLTDAEAKKFWPIYDSYQREYDMLNRRLNTALEMTMGTVCPNMTKPGRLSTAFRGRLREERRY